MKNRIRGIFFTAALVLSIAALPVLPATAAVQLGDGVTERYALLFSGDDSDTMWGHMAWFYSLLTAHYDYPADHIYVHFYDGYPNHNDEGIPVDGDGSQASLEAAIDLLAARADADDEVVLFFVGHGAGYYGLPNVAYFGNSLVRPEVQPGDEQDYLEREFKLRSFYNDGRKAGNHGMNELRVVMDVYYDFQPYYRYKIVSSFEDITFNITGKTESDQDYYAEKLVDYLLGDTNQDGQLDPFSETADYDQDGRPPFDVLTGEYDEDDWGVGWDTYWEVRDVGTAVPGESYLLYDAGMDGKIDIDINPDYERLEVDGTDLDNNGLFDGLDVNDDGDMDDWVSIDEAWVMYNGPWLTDDTLAELVHRIHARAVTVMMDTCFSGGFIDDLSAPGFIIMTSTIEEHTAALADWGFLTQVTNAFYGVDRYDQPVNADRNEDGSISMREAFEYAAEWGIYLTPAQYDDNGDGISTAFPLPNAGEGTFGAGVFLVDPPPIPPSYSVYFPLTSR